MAVKIYTKTGDTGETSLYGGQRVSKVDLRVEAYGAVDELNSVIGVAVAQMKNEKRKTKNDSVKLKSELEKISHDLYDIGALLATPQNVRVTRGQIIHKKLPQYLQKRTKEIEIAIDMFTKKIPPLQAFILPGGGISGAMLHYARTVCRRAERRIIALHKKETIPQEIIMYMNRLSDLLFTTARFSNHIEKQPEIFWDKKGTV